MIGLICSYQFIVYANVSSNQSMLSETTPELDDYVKVGVSSHMTSIVIIITN